MGSARRIPQCLAGHTPSPHFTLRMMVSSCKVRCCTSFNTYCVDWVFKPVLGFLLFSHTGFYVNTNFKLVPRHVPSQGVRMMASSYKASASALHCTFKNGYFRNRKRVGTRRKLSGFMLAGEIPSSGPLTGTAMYISSKLAPGLPDNSRLSVNILLER